MTASLRPLVLAALLAATSACAPKPAETTRLSTQGETGCAFSPDTCADLHKTRASIW
jgi:hypothetical protein